MPRSGVWTHQSLGLLGRQRSNGEVILPSLHLFSILIHLICFCTLQLLNNLDSWLPWRPAYNQRKCEGYKSSLTLPKRGCRSPPHTPQRTTLGQTETEKRWTVAGHQTLASRASWMWDFPHQAFIQESPARAAAPPRDCICGIHSQLSTIVADAWGVAHCENRWHLSTQDLQEEEQNEGTWLL